MGLASIQRRRRPRTYEGLHGVDVLLKPRLVGIKDLVDRSVEDLSSSLKTFSLRLA
jgi:hypothetical protein